jgi:ABC-2 type transport system ATP-binding protein
MMLAVETDKLVKKFGDFTALDGLDLKIEQGETYGLLGPNGSGKTTTIKLLIGLLGATSGTARVLGKTIPSKEVMQHVGYMPQESAIYIDNTVHENLRLFGTIYDMPEEVLVKREKEMLDFVDLARWKGAIASNLIGGMRHRLSLACALHFLIFSGSTSAYCIAAFCSWANGGSRSNIILTALPAFSTSAYSSGTNLPLSIR